MLRPTFYEFEDDPQAFADCDEFMVGNALLVAPVVEPGATTRRVYLPTRADGATEWVDFHTGDYHTGGEHVSVDAPLERLPLFVRAGAVLALTDNVDCSLLHDEPSRRLCVYPLRNSPAADFASDLYEDDGLSLDYRNGKSSVLSFAVTYADAGLKLAVERSGKFELPYEHVRVLLPPAEKRPLVVEGGDGLKWVIPG
jgi:alpha-glucosidase